MHAPPANQSSNKKSPNLSTAEHAPGRKARKDGQQTWTTNVNGNLSSSPCHTHVKKIPDLGILVLGGLGNCIPHLVQIILHDLQRLIA
eukprot:1157600-Pelagomonas_calceolata.AAC.2